MCVGYYFDIMSSAPHTKYKSIRPETCLLGQPENVFRWEQRMTGTRERIVSRNTVKAA